MAGAPTHPPTHPLRHPPQCEPHPTVHPPTLLGECGEGGHLVNPSVQDGRRAAVEESFPRLCAAMVHPQLTLENNPQCVEQILAFKRCHEENDYLHKLFGACNEHKQVLDACFKTQKKGLRKDHLAKARADRERWQQRCEEFAG
jgi:hypothetical protein